VEPPRSNRRRGATVTPVDSVPNSPAAPVTWVESYLSFARGGDVSGS
jgi:hypothetical protein